VPLKLEIKPNERIILGGCLVTNQGPRTRLLIKGTVPILREKDIMTAAQANSPAKRVYFAIQRMYTSSEREKHGALCSRMLREFLRASPNTRMLIERINNRILTGELYKALKETRKLIAHEKERSPMNYAAKAYANVAKETASPRELEANLLLTATSKLQAVLDSWRDKPTGLHDALMYNRRLWMVFIDAIQHDGNKLPIVVRDNLTKLGAFVLGETFALMTKPKPDHLKSIIKINRGIAAGLSGKR